MGLRVEALSNWWVFESLCVSNLLCLRAVSAAYPPHKCETTLASPKYESVFFRTLVRRQGFVHTSRKGCKLLQLRNIRTTTQKKDVAHRPTSPCEQAATPPLFPSLQQPT